MKVTQNKVAIVNLKEVYKLFSTMGPNYLL